MQWLSSMTPPPFLRTGGDRRIRSHHLAHGDWRMMLIQLLLPTTLPQATPEGGEPIFEW